MIEWTVGKALLVLLYRDAGRTLAEVAQLVGATRGEVNEALEYLDEHPVHESVRLLNLRGRRA